MSNMNGLDVFCGIDTRGGVNTRGVEDVTKLLASGARIVIWAINGAIIFAIAGAVGWKKHRVIGGVLGGFVVGPAAGGGLGYLLSRKDLKEVAARSDTTPPALPAAGKATVAGPLKVGDKIRGKSSFGGAEVQAGTIEKINTSGPQSTTVFVRWADGSASDEESAKLERSAR